MSGANYGGRQPNNSAYIKNFNYGTPANLWTVIPYNNANGTIEAVITPTTSRFESVYIPGNLYVDGNIIRPSDVNLKGNIETIATNKIDKIMNLNPSQFTFNDDPLKNTHYGFIAQDFENDFPELVSIKPDKNLANIKAINYLEIIPLLVNKIQIMQKEIDELKATVTNNQIHEKLKKI